ncbi:MAG TPA: flagellar hook-basal body complex protein FliE [Roseiarcus sp.]|nr:flagellar hook-basal body complex protein FliE [Roseiarcus sp.]
MMITGLAPLASLGADGAATVAPLAQAGGVSFEEALGNVLGSAIGTLKAGETAAIEGIEGAASPMKVVESVMEAQRSLQTVLAIRDKIVSAWQEISHLAI